MSLDSRSTRSALFKRAEQLKRWEESDTNREPSVINGENRRIKFSAGCVFLAACAAGDKEEVLSLLKKGADIDTTNVDGLSALHQACIDDNLEMVEFLVEHGADVNKGDNEGWTPLHATASCGFISIAKYLMEKGANVSAVNYDGELPVDIAESDEMEDMLQQQIDIRGIDAEDARTEEQRMMLEDAKNWLSSGRVQEKVHPKTGATSLHVSSAKGYIKVMHILLEAGCDVDCVDLDGWTPLHAAAHWGQKEASKLLVEHFCDMDIKNCVGQTAFDVADSQMVSYLEELRKKQSSLSRLSYNKKKNNNNIQMIESIGNKKDHLERMETEKYDESNVEIKNKVPLVPQIEVQIQPVPNDNQSRLEKKNYSKKEEQNRISSTVEVSNQVPTTPAPMLPPRLTPVEDDDSNVPSWRRPGSFRNKDETPKFNLHLTREVAARNNERINTVKPETPQEVSLRRTQSFEADEKFYRRYLELRAKINAGNNNNYSVINSPARSASLKEKHFARRGQVKEDPRYGGTTAVGGTLPSVTLAGYVRSSLTSPVTTPTSPVSGAPALPSPTSVAPPLPTSPIPSPTSPVFSVPSTPVPTTTTTSSSTPSFLTPASTLTTTSSSSTPTGSPQHTNQVRRSFVPPVRDEESETQRKAHAKRVRETRRSTQGVTLEEIKSAGELVKKKQQEAAIAAVTAASTPTTPQLESPGTPDVVFTLPITSQSREKVETTKERKTSPVEEGVAGTGQTVVSATILKDGKGTVSVVGDRRPSWRLRVNNGSKFMLEDARTTAKDEESEKESWKEIPTKNSVETGETTVTLPLRRSRTEDREQDKENDSRSGQATQGVIQRRRKPKRRSTGVVRVDMDEIDPERNAESNDTSNDVDVSFRINSFQSGGEKEKDEPVSRVSQTEQQVDDSESASENGEIDYKKLYEESQSENQRLRDKLKKTEDDLTRAKLMSEKVPYVPMRNSLSEAEKREKKAMERKLSEMEEELKQLQKLKAENERLKAENRALTRVVSKLTASHNAT